MKGGLSSAVVADGKRPALILAGDIIERRFRPERLHANGLRLATLALILWAWLSIDNFATAANFRAILYSVSAVGIAAVGMALITLSGNLFMLSMAATAAASTIIFATFLQLGLFPAMLVVIAAGAFLGLAQGVAVGFLGANPIIATIAIASIIMGAGALYSGGLTVMGQGDASWLGIGHFAGVIPNQVLLFGAAVVLAEILVEKTRFGRELRMIGVNRAAAEMAGLRIERVIVWTYVLAGVCAAVAGGLFASQAAQGNLRLGAGLDFDAIAAVLVGGVSIRGGRGRIIDAASGALFLAIVSNVLLVKGLTFEVQLVVKGAVVVVSVMLGSLALNLKGR